MENILEEAMEVDKAIITDAIVVDEIQYVPKYVNDAGKPIAQMLKIPIFFEKQTIKVVAWGEAADVLAKVIQLGTHIDLLCKLSSKYPTILRWAVRSTEYESFSEPG
jgi:hypothetical protein